MRRLRPLLALLGLVTIAALVIAAAVLAPPHPRGAQHTYGYSLSVSTNATLQDVRIDVPIPETPDGRSPIADAIAAGSAEVPAGWTATVERTQRGLVLRLAAEEVRPGRRADGRTYETYEVRVSVPTDRAIETGDPFGTEPTVATQETLRERPCPNVVNPDPGTTCYAFDATVSVAYEAPRTASVTAYLVTAGSTTLPSTTDGHRQYYERLSMAFDGPQDGQQVVVGFARTEAE